MSRKSWYKQDCLPRFVFVLTIESWMQPLVRTTSRYPSSTNAWMLGWTWVLLFFRWVLRMQLDPHYCRRPGEDYVHLPIWNFCLQTHALWIVQRSRDIPTVHAQSFLRYGRTFSRNFHGWFSIYGDSFDQRLHHLELVLQRCKEKNLTLNWEKYHFMVRRGIVLGHEISRRGIKVDKAKIEVIAKLPPPKCIKDIRSFLEHDGFYWRFIKDFSKIARSLTNLLAKDVPFDFNDGCFKS